jgi:hypothetical protein
MTLKIISSIPQFSATSSSPQFSLSPSPTVQSFTLGVCCKITCVLYSLSLDISAGVLMTSIKLQLVVVGLSLLRI